MHLYLTFLHLLSTHSLVLPAYCESMSASGIPFSSSSGLIFCISLFSFSPDSSHHFSYIWQIGTWLLLLSPRESDVCSTRLVKDHFFPPQSQSVRLRSLWICTQGIFCLRSYTFQIQQILFWSRLCSIRGQFDGCWRTHLSKFRHHKRAIRGKEVSDMERSVLFWDCVFVCPHAGT